MKTIVLPSRQSLDARLGVAPRVTVITHSKTAIHPLLVGFCLLFLIAAAAAVASLR
jgi:hypothetical protein